MVLDSEIKLQLLIIALAKQAVQVRARCERRGMDGESLWSGGISEGI